MFNIFKKLDTLKNKKTKSSPVEYIVAGLGNPGLAYEKTRHNAGFMAVDYIALRSNTELAKFKFKSLFAECEISSKKVILLKPQTFMNNSGQAVLEAVSFYKIQPSNIIVVCDDVYLSPGKLRIRRKGSHGGQNGMKDIIELLGSQDFLRIKLGIGSKPQNGWNLADWVLSKFNEDEKLRFNIALQNSYEALKLVINGDIDQAMSKYNS